MFLYLLEIKLETLFRGIRQVLKKAQCHALAPMFTFATPSYQME
jgi:hypothetical protein